MTMLDKGTYGIGGSSAAISGRKWSDYSLVKAPYEGSAFIKQYIERFSTVSYFNEIAGLLSYFFIAGQALAPYIRVPIHGAFIDCRLHVFWVQQSRTGKSIAWEFTSKVLKKLGIKIESFSAGSDAKLIGTVEEKAVYDDEGKPTGQMEYEVVPGLLNGYKSMLFDEASVLLNDKKAYFSDKILYMQQAMAPIGSETNVLVKHLVGGSVHTPSGVSFWMTTFPPKDIMAHVLDKGFFQRVFLFQNDVGIETRRTVSEHRMEGVYVPVPQSIISYDQLASNVEEMVEDVKERLFTSAGIDQEGWDSLSDQGREDIAQNYAHALFNVGPSYHAALLSAVDDYYDLVGSVQNELVRETALSFIPNVENYTVILSNLIAATMRSNVITSTHVQMATEIIYDNLHNLIIWLENKQDFRQTKKRDTELRSWKQAYNKCDRKVHDRLKKEVVKKAEIEKVYSSMTGVSVKTARRRLDVLIDAKVMIRTMEGRNAYIAMEV